MNIPAWIAVACVVIQHSLYVFAEAVNAGRHVIQESKTMSLGS